LSTPVNDRSECSHIKHASMLSLAVLELCQEAEAVGMGGKSICPETAKAAQPRVRSGWLSIRCNLTRRDRGWQGIPGLVTGAVLCTHHSVPPAVTKGERMSAPP
jgi:hypothetical protein